MKVQTIKGLIDIEQLEVVDIITLEDNARVIATEWKFDGEIVKRDVHVAILRGQSLASEAQQI